MREMPTLALPEKNLPTFGPLKVSLEPVLILQGIHVRALSPAVFYGLLDLRHDEAESTGF